MCCRREKALLKPFDFAAGGRRYCQGTVDVLQEEEGVVEVCDAAAAGSQQQQCPMELLLHGKVVTWVPLLKEGQGVTKVAWWYLPERLMTDLQGGGA